MATSVEQLLRPVSEETPSGEDLAYDVERTEIEQVFERSVSSDTTGAASDEGETDWRRIISLIEAQSTRTKDVWLAVYLTRAGARAKDLDLVVTGAEFLAGLCEQFWDSVHPQMDEYGYQGRKGPCESLTRNGEFLNPLRRVPLLIHSRLGQFSGADFERFRANSDAEEGYGLFRGVLSETPEETLQTAIGKIEAIKAAIKRADAVLTAEAQDDTGPNFTATYDTLDEMKRAVASFTSAPAPEAAAEDAGAGPASADTGGGPRIAGRVDSREDVVRALDAIGDYYRRREPTSPVPIVLQRAREWVNVDFLELLRDIAPDALDEAKKVLKFRAPEASEGGSGW
jgi:type VI secretion system ImpA family protein